MGDQIVEINGKRVSAFDEFLERFVAAQVQAPQKLNPKKQNMRKRRVSLYRLYVSAWISLLCFYMSTTNYRFFLLANWQNNVVSLLSNPVL